MQDISRNVMKCHVLSCSSHRRRRFAARFLHITPPSRSAPFRRRGVPLPRAFRVRACPRVGAGAVRAPDCAREAQGARLPSVSRGFSRTGADAGGNGLRTPLPSVPFYHNFLYVKLKTRIISEIYRTKSRLPMEASRSAAKLPRGGPSVAVVPNRFRVEPVGRDEAAVPLLELIPLPCRRASAA